ncbi:hypothetical protein [Microbacterium sp. H83]|uniref:hypothetical protein n=1 Tax=Microbacterium sp. H83 TaxID=1827324 RepID=UPI0007F47E8E|nr:hypothetical protein [Microbacterium sp. H83]OAN43254.1 hypothetical protein A4X16_08250 [Microbacterium sp. H83]
MDSPLPYIAVIVVVIVLAMLLPRWIRRTSGSAAERETRRLAEPRTAAALETLGTTMVVHSGEPVVRELVDSIALQHPRAFTILPDGTYGVRFAEADDAIARLVEVDGGTRVEISRFREYAGMPNDWAFWTELLRRVQAGAEARGLATTAGPRLRFDRGRGSDPLWSAVGADHR